MPLNKPLQMILVSNSRLFLEGMRKILEHESSIEIVAEVPNLTAIGNYLNQIKPEFLFLDNTTFNFDINDISKLQNLINKKSPDTKVILFGDQNKRDEITFTDVIYVTRNTDYAELVSMIKNPNERMTRCFSVETELNLLLLGLDMLHFYYNIEE